MDFEDGRYWGMHHGVGWAGGLMMLLLFLVCVGVLVALILVLVRGQGARAVTGASAVQQSSQPGSAERTLDDRLARGEIDVVEYRERRSALHDSA